MKLFIFLASLVISASAFALDTTCFQYAEGPKEVTIGWFKKKTVTADTVCVPARYPEEGFTEKFQFVLKNGTEVVAEYEAVAERYSETAVRYTLMNGEPEPQQFNAEVTKNSKSLVEIEFTGYLIELSSGGAYECTEDSDVIGSVRKLRLVQIDGSTQWKLDVYSQAVVPHPVPTTEVSTVLTVTLMEDVMFFLENKSEGTVFHIYMDELYATYLTLGNGKQYTFNCEIK